MDEIHQESLKELLNRKIKVESGRKVYSGVLMSVDARRIQLRTETNPRRTITILINDIDAVMYRVAHKKVGY